MWKIPPFVFCVEWCRLVFTVTQHTHICANMTLWHQNSKARLKKVVVLRAFQNSIVLHVAGFAPWQSEVIGKKLVHYRHLVALNGITRSAFTHVQCPAVHVCLSVCPFVTCSSASWKRLNFILNQFGTVQSSPLIDTEASSYHGQPERWSFSA